MSALKLNFFSRMLTVLKFFVYASFFGEKRLQREVGGGGGGVLCLLSKFLGTKLNIFRHGKITPKEHNRGR